MIRIIKAISLSGEEIAEEFWEKNCEEQANFFNKNKLKDNDWNHGRALIQIDNFVDMLDDNGREFIEKIYNSLQGWHYYND
jgi:hypothetical protein